MGIFKFPKFGGNRGEQLAGAEQVVTECYCMNGHSLIGPHAVFRERDGITLLLRSGRSEGLISLSPVIGDLDRRFFDFEPLAGENADICCPVCKESLPVYDLCPCGAPLAALFLSPNAEFSNCIGICQRFGCLHSEIKSNRDLRIFSRLGYFESNAVRARR